MNRAKLSREIARTDMGDKAHEIIKQIDYPNCHKDSFIQISNILKDSLKSDGPPLDFEPINLGKIPKELEVPLHFFLWISEINEVIESLNIVISDLRILGDSYFMFKVSPRKRFYLLVRTYFHEFYRIREIFNRNIRVLEARGFLKKEDTKQIRKIFLEAFKETFDIRNTIVHRTINWRGRGHFDLTLIDMAEELGFVLKNKKSGRIASLKDALNRLCYEMSKTFLREGQKISDVIQNTINFLVKYIAKQSA
jgi:hypothetical protein